MGKVRVVYMIASDSSESAEYTDAIGNAVNDVRWWYKQQLDATFTWGDPVRVVQSEQTGAWFSQNRAKQLKDNAYYRNTLDQAKLLLDVAQNNGDWVWVIYCDAPGDKGRGGAEVCIMPGDDLLGLVGRHPTQKRISRWRGGLAHEIGHAFGLPEGPATQGVDGYDGVMSHGFPKYPKTFLTEAEKTILRKSPYFYGKGVAALGPGGARGASAAAGAIARSGGRGGLAGRGWS